MTTSIVYNQVSTDMRAEEPNGPEPVYVRYPTSTEFPVDTIVRYMPKVSPVKISFAPDTNFDYKNKSKVAEKVKRSNYTFRPVSEKRRNSLKFQAPASTLPSSTFVTTNRQDYTDTREHLKRSLKPAPKWFYRSQTNLQELGSNSMDPRDKTSSLPDCSKVNKNYARSLVLFPHPARAKTLDSFSSNPESYEYKPLIGERVILKARIMRELPNYSVVADSYTGGKVDNRKNSKFSESLNRYDLHNNADIETQKKPSHVYLPPKQAPAPNVRQPSSSVHKVTSDMERTYGKQATLRDMIRK